MNLECFVCGETIDTQKSLDCRCLRWDICITDQPFEDEDPLENSNGSEKEDQDD